MKMKPLLATGSLAALALLGFSLTATEPAESSSAETSSAETSSAVAPDYVSLDVRGEPLKSAFNADADKVRLLMLVAPT
jgi:hypothetical protein